MLSDRHRALHVTFLVAYERTTNRVVFELMTQSKHESLRKVGTGARMRLNNADKKVFAFQFSGFFSLLAATQAWALKKLQNPSQ